MRNTNDNHLNLFQLLKIIQLKLLTYCVLFPYNTDTCLSVLLVLKIFKCTRWCPYFGGLTLTLVCTEVLLKKFHLLGHSR